MEKLNKKIVLFVGAACLIVLLLTGLLSFITINSANNKAKKMVPEKTVAASSEKTDEEEDEIVYEDDGSDTEYEAGYNDNGDGIRMKRKVLRDEDTGVALASVYVPDGWEAALNMNWQNASLNNPLYGTITLTSPEGVGIVLWTKVDYMERKTEFAKATVKETQESDASDKKSDKKTDKKSEEKTDDNKLNLESAGDATKFKPVEVEVDGGIDFKNYATTLSYMTPEEYTSYFMQSMNFELSEGKVKEMESDALDAMKEYAKEQAEENMRDINALYEANMGRKVTLDNVESYVYCQSGKAKMDGKDLYIETICKEYMWDYRLPLGFDATVEATGKDLSCHEIYWSIPQFSLYIAPSPELYSQYYDVYQILLANMGVTNDFDSISEYFSTTLKKKLLDGADMEEVNKTLPTSISEKWEDKAAVKYRDDQIFDDRQSEEFEKNMKDKTKFNIPDVNGNIFSNGKYIVYSKVSDYHPGAGYDQVN